MFVELYLWWVKDTHLFGGWLNLFFWGHQWEEYKLYEFDANEIKQLVYNFDGEARENLVYDKVIPRNMALFTPVYACTHICCWRLRPGMYILLSNPFKAAQLSYKISQRTWGQPKPSEVSPPPVGKVFKKVIISPYFSFSQGENCPKLHFFGIKLSR